MKYFLFILLFTGLLINTYAQQPTTGYDVNVNKGSTTTLTWKVPGDFSAYDSLYFAVKACTTSSCGWLIGPSKSGTVSYSNPYSTVSVVVYSTNTAGLNAAKYYYSVYAYGGDTVAVRSGVFNLQLNGQTVTDGIATTSPVYILAVDSSDQEPGVLIGRNSNNTNDWWSLGTLADSIGVVGGTAADLDSLYTKTGDYYSVESFGAVHDGVTDDTEAIQAALDAQVPLYFPAGRYIISSTLRPAKTGTIDYIPKLVGAGYSVISSDLTSLTPNATIIKQTADSAVFKFTSLRNIYMSDFTILGSGKDNTNCIGLYLYNSNSTWAFERIGIDSCYTAIQLGEGDATQANNSEGSFRDINIKNCHNSIRTFTSQGYNNKYYSCWFQSDMGIVQDRESTYGGSVPQFFGCSFNIRDTVLKAQSNAVGLFSGCYFESNAGSNAPMLFYSGGSGLSFVSAVFSGCYFNYAGTLYSTTDNWIYAGNTGIVITNSIIKHPNPIIRVTPSQSITFKDNYWYYKPIIKRTDDSGVEPNVILRGENYAYENVNSANGGTVAVPSSQYVDVFSVFGTAQYWKSSLPTNGTYEQGDIIWDTSPESEGFAGWVCITAGTEGTLNSTGTTGSISSASDTLTVNDSTGLVAGMYIDVIGLSGSSYKIDSLSGLNVYLDAVANTDLTDAVITYSNPVWNTFGVITSVNVDSLANALDQSVNLEDLSIGDKTLAGSLLSPSTSDSVLSVWSNYYFEIDSIDFIIPEGDTASFNLKYGANGYGTEIFTTPDTLGASATITNFDENFLTANNRGYLYFLYMTTPLRLDWRIHGRQYNLLPETVTYYNRVIADGGIVYDLDAVNNFINNAIEKGYYDSLLAVYSASFGVYKDGNNLVTKVYNVIGTDDLIQSVDSLKWEWYADSLLSKPTFKVGGEGVYDYMKMANDFDATNGASLFMTVSDDTTGFYRYLVGSDSSGNYGYLLNTSGTGQLYLGGFTSGSNALRSIPPELTPYTGYNIGFTIGSDSSVVAYVNGVSRKNATLSGIDLDWNNAMIFGRALVTNPGGTYNGKISAIIISKDVTTLPNTYLNNFYLVY